MVMPVRGIQPQDLANNFGADRDNGSRKHEGLDIMAPMNREVIACRSGIIDAKKWNNLGGNTIWLRGDDNYYYYFAHLAKYRDGIEEGRRVMAGEVIGYVGSTGNATTPHLHFEIHTDKKSPAINPFSILRQDGILVMALAVDTVTKLPGKAAKKQR